MFRQNSFYIISQRLQCPIREKKNLDLLTPKINLIMSYPKE